MISVAPMQPLGSVSRQTYAQSYRRTAIYQDRLTDQFFIEGSPGEQFGSLSLCEDEIDRRKDVRLRDSADRLGVYGQSDDLRRFA